MASKIESKCRSGAEHSLSQSSLSITNQNKDYNSNKRIALFTSSSFCLFGLLDKDTINFQKNLIAPKKNPRVDPKLINFDVYS